MQARSVKRSSRKTGSVLSMPTTWCISTLSGEFIVTSIHPIVERIQTIDFQVRACYRSSTWYAVGERLHTTPLGNTE